MYMPLWVTTRPYPRVAHDDSDTWQYISCLYMLAVGYCCRYVCISA